jgi:hypothetical protein
MNRTIAGLVGGIVLATTGTAVAAVRHADANAQPLSAGQSVTYAGLTCTAYAGTTATNANLVCVRTNLKGFGVVVSQDAVIVAKQVGGKVKVLYKVKNG